MGTRDELTDYQYRGARASVILHDQQMRKFLDTWRVAKSSGVALPETDDPSYESFDALLRHVLSWSRRYMVWMCEKLELPSFELPSPPPTEEVAEKVESYLEQLLVQWRVPLAHVPTKRFRTPEYVAPWDIKYCIDAMLEHAVMHPIRHRFQLMELMEGS
jgi:hypothetical protein